MTFNRGTLTAALLTQIQSVLTPLNAHVGDGLKPVAGGWSGQPGAPGSSFVPYCVLTPMTASATSGPVGDPQADTQAPYRLDSIGVTREQCEWIADHARGALDALTHTVLALGSSYQVQQVWGTSIGGTQYAGDSADPAFWGQTDVLTIWLTKE